MKTKDTKKTPPFIKTLALVLSVVIFRTSLAGAAPVLPGTLAVLEPHLSLPEMRAAWDAIRKEIYLDPLLLVKGREEVRKALGEWSSGTQSVRSAYETADGIALARVEDILEKAWGLYYQFDYAGAGRILAEGEKLLDTPGDSGFRAHLLFEIQILKAVASRAAGRKAYIRDFEKAAALEPSRTLPPERYSPEIISVYQGIRREFLDGKMVPVSLTGTPTDGVIYLDGQDKGRIQPDSEIRVFPGKHFFEFLAPGYEPQSLVIDAGKSEPISVHFELSPLGPEGDSDTFFLERVRTGDRAYMMLLAGRLKVDYLLLPDPDGSVLNAWLLDKEGRSVKRAVLWEEGSSTESGARRAEDLLDTIRLRWPHDRTNEIAPLSLPAPYLEPPGGVNSEEGSTKWTKYAVALGILLLVGAAAGADGGSTKIEASW